MRFLPYGVLIGIVAYALFAMPARTVQLTFKESHNTLRIENLPAAPLPPQVPKKALVSIAPRQQLQPKSPATSTPSDDISVVFVPPPIQKVVTNEIPIDLRSVVAVKCMFKNSSGAQVTTYGSGVVVNAEGYVLTARHVIDMGYTYRITDGKQGLLNYSLDSCRIAVPSHTIQTPTPAEIRTLNPFTPVTDFAYGAQLAFVPPEQLSSGMSEGEYRFVDSALLRITSATSGIVPNSFIASPMKITELPAEASEIVSFGFPSGIPSYGSNFYLQGSVGEIKDIVGGDALFKNQPVGMTAVLETIGGRSGSPVFWRGYVIGIISSKEDYSRNTAITAVFPIARFAEEAGLAVFK